MLMTEDLSERACEMLIPTNWEDCHSLEGVNRQYLLFSKWEMWSESTSYFSQLGGEWEPSRQIMLDTFLEPLGQAWSLGPKLAGILYLTNAETLEQVTGLSGRGGNNKSEAMSVVVYLENVLSPNECGLEGKTQNSDPVNIEFE